MESFIRAALGAIPQAATNSRSIAAYFVACLAWAVVSFRVNRNKNLLNSIDKLPKDQRLDALRMEMGAIPIKQGVSPEQFLRARRHMYYFWAFVVLCVLIVAVFAIAISVPNGNQVDDEFANLDSKVRRLGFKQSPEYLIEQFGQPVHIDKTIHFKRYVWDKPLFWLIVEFSQQGATDFVFESKDWRLSPLLPFGLNGRLGDRTFEELKGVPLTVNYSSHGEEFAVTDPANGTDLTDMRYQYFGWANWGISDKMLAKSPNFTPDFEIWLAAIDEFGSGKPRDKMAVITRNLRPNAFAVHRFRLDEERDCKPTRNVRDHRKNLQLAPTSEESEKCAWISLWYVNWSDTFAY